MTRNSFQIRFQVPLDRFDLKAEFTGSKRVTGLFGASGSGKSTVGDLLFRFYEPTNGRITIDVNKHEPMTIGFDQVANAKLLLTDALIASTRPLSTEGVEEEEFEEEAPEGAERNPDDIMNEGQD